MRRSIPNRPGSGTGPVPCTTPYCSGRPTHAGPVEDRPHGGVVGEDVAGEPGDAVLPGRDGERPEHQPAQPVALDVVGQPEADLCLRAIRRQSEVAGLTHRHVAIIEGHPGEVIVVVGVGQMAEIPFRRRRPEEAPVPALER